MSTARELVQDCLQGNPIAATQKFEELVGKRIEDAIATRKEQIASTMLGVDLNAENDSE